MGQVVPVMFFIVWFFFLFLNPRISKKSVLNLVVVFLWFCQSFCFFCDIDTFGEFKAIVENVYSLDLSHCYHLWQERTYVMIYLS